MRLIFLGPPGAGKGTQAEIISEEYDFLHVSTGEMLRNEIKNGTELGKKAKKYVNNGELVPDNLVIEILQLRLKESEKHHGIILDGFPRNLKQAESLEKKDILDVDHVLYFKLDKEIIIERLSHRLYCPDCKKFYNLKFNPPKKDNICDKCGRKLVRREDDKLESIKKRLEIYNEKTYPLIDHYKKLNKLIEIDASQTIEEIKGLIEGRINLEKA